MKLWNFENYGSIESKKLILLFNNRNFSKILSVARKYSRLRDLIINFNKNFSVLRILGNGYNQIQSTLVHYTYTYTINTVSKQPLFPFYYSTCQKTVQYWCQSSIGICPKFWNQYNSDISPVHFILLAEKTT